jgi:hypothetical protein
MQERLKIVAYTDFLPPEEYQGGRTYFVLWFKGQDDVQGRVENFCHFCGAKTEVEE